MDNNSVEVSVASVYRAVSICEVNDKPERVRHDRDVLFRTPKVSLFPFKFHSTSISNTGKKMAAQQKNLKAMLTRRATENEWCASVLLFTSALITRFSIAF